MSTHLAPRKIKKINRSFVITNFDIRIESLCRKIDINERNKRLFKLSIKKK